MERDLIMYSIVVLLSYCNLNRKWSLMRQHVRCHHNHYFPVNGSSQPCCNALGAYLSHKCLSNTHSVQAMCNLNAPGLCKWEETLWQSWTVSQLACYQRTFNSTVCFSSTGSNKTGCKRKILSKVQFIFFVFNLSLEVVYLPSYKKGNIVWTLKFYFV